MQEATKQQVYDIVKRELTKHPWSSDQERFTKALEAVKRTLEGSRSCAFTESWVVAWREIGRKGKPTYKALHALPGEIVDGLPEAAVAPEVAPAKRVAAINVERAMQRSRSHGARMMRAGRSATRRR